MFLLGGGNYFYTDTSHPFTGDTTVVAFSQNQQDHFTNKGQTGIVIENADLDIEEEHQGNDEVSEGDSNPIFNSAVGLQSNWYLTHFHPLFLNTYSKGLNTYRSIQGTTTPIYITNRVFRI